jgi:cysteine-rich repeat protein
MTRLKYLAGAAFAVVTSASFAFAWRIDVDDTPPDARPFALAVDASANVVAGGRKPGAAGDSDGIVVKLRASDGAKRWIRTITGNKDGNDIVRGLLVDDHDNVYAFGQIGNTTTNADGLLTKLRAQDGQPQWRTEIDGGRRGSDDVRTGFMTNTGDLLLAGASPTTGSNDVITVWHVDGGDGVVDWTRRLPGPGGTAEWIAGSGNAVYVAAHVPTTDDGTRILVARLDQVTGKVVWTRTLEESGSARDRVTGLALRGTSHVILAAELHGSNTAPDFVVAALATNLGNEVWRATLDGSATGDDDHDAAHGVVVDAEGNVLAAGILSAVDSKDDMALVKLRGNDGHELWRRVVDGSASGSDDALGITLDGTGNAIVVGRLRNVGTNSDMAAVKVDGVSGAVIWEHDEDGALSASDTGFYATVDSTGQVALAGRLRNGDTADGFSVARLAGVNGGSWPCGDGVLEEGEMCDDANPVHGDGCRNDCTIEVCGDARLDPGEICDVGPAGDDCCQPDCQPRADGTPCNDGKVCTTDDQCTNGLCAGTKEGNCPVSGCMVTVCDPVSGACTDVVQANGTECDDGDTCTTGDRCSNGACVPAERSFCDDDDPCTSDECDESQGCVFTAVRGFQSVLCVLERRGIQSECRDPLPARLNAKIERVASMLYLAYTQPTPALASVALKRTALVAKRARRVTLKQFRRAHLPFECAQAVVQTMDDLRNRITALRGELAALRSG